MSVSRLEGNTFNRNFENSGNVSKTNIEIKWIQALAIIIIFNNKVSGKASFFPRMEELPDCSLHYFNHRYSTSMKIKEVMGNN